MGAEHGGCLFHFDNRWLMRKDAGESGPRNDTAALEQNHNSGEQFIDNKWIDK